MATDPDVLLCDEPTSALDLATTDEILDLITALKARLGLAVLVITHEMHVVKRICDSVSLLEGGRTIESGNLVDVVGSFGSRLSEALIGLPPSPVASPVPGGVIEVLQTGAAGEASVLAATSTQLGVDLPVLAGTVEQLSGTTFQHWRVAVPAPLNPEDVVARLRDRGAQAAVVVR